MFLTFCYKVQWHHTTVEISACSSREEKFNSELWWKVHRPNSQFQWKLAGFTCMVDSKVCSMVSSFIANYSNSSSHQLLKYTLRRSNFLYFLWKVKLYSRSCWGTENKRLWFCYIPYSNQTMHSHYGKLTNINFFYNPNWDSMFEYCCALYI